MTSNRTHRLGVSEPAHTWGRNIRNQRELLGLSREDVAEFCGVTRQAVQQWETGKTVPSHRLVHSIAEVLRSTPDLLFPWSAAPRRQEVA